MSPTVKFAIARSQGLFYAITGIWPIAHMNSFLAVTGPKHDLALVRLLGALLVAVGAVMLLSTTEDRLGLTCKRLGIAVASVLAVADVLFALRDGMSLVYLADAAIEATFVVAWLVTIGADRTLRRRVAQTHGFPGTGVVSR